MGRGGGGGGGVHITCEQYDNETLFDTNMRQALHVKKDKQSGNFGKGVQSNFKTERKGQRIWNLVKEFSHIHNLVSQFLKCIV